MKNLETKNRVLSVELWVQKLVRVDLSHRMKLSSISWRRQVNKREVLLHGLRGFAYSEDLNPLKRVSNPCLIMFLYIFYQANIIMLLI